MKFALIFCLLAVALSMAQRQSVVVLPSIADSRANLKPEELELLTENVRSIVLDVLPLKDFNLLKQDVVRERLGDEALFIACKEGTCVGELVARAQADFGARCDILSVNRQLYLKFELYGTLRGERESGTIAQFNEPVKNFAEMQALIAKKVPTAIQRMIIEPVPTETQASVKQTTPAPVVKDNILTDSRDGKIYKIIKIGEQTWMAENLNYNAEGSRCYDNKSENCTKYGRLYNWKTAKNVCPNGWHLPSTAEWKSLITAVGGTPMAGIKLKATNGWNKEGGGVDDFDFSALSGGFGYSESSFSGVGFYGYWWSADEFGASYAYRWGLSYNAESTSHSYYNKTYLFSSRCVQDV